MIKQPVLRFVFAATLALVLPVTSQGFTSYTYPFPLIGPPEMHQRMTTEALKNSYQVGQKRLAFTDDAIDLINERIQKMDLPTLYDAPDHFDNEDFAGSLDRLRERRMKLVDELTKSQPSPFTAWYLFGAILHATQDFYSHSTWVREATRASKTVELAALTRSGAATPDYLRSKPPGDVCSDSRKAVIPGAPLSTGYYNVSKPDKKCIHGDTIASVTSNCDGSKEPDGIALDSICQGELVRIAAARAREETVAITQSIIDDLLAAKAYNGICLLMHRSFADCASGLIEVFEFKGSALDSDPYDIPYEKTTFYQYQSNRPGSTSTTAGRTYINVASTDPFRACRIGGSWMPKTQTDYFKHDLICETGATCSSDITWTMNMSSGGTVDLQKVWRRASSRPHLAPGAFSRTCGFNNSSEQTYYSRLTVSTGEATGGISFWSRSLEQLNEVTAEYCASLDRVENSTTTGTGSWPIPLGARSVPANWTFVRSLPSGSAVPAECSTSAADEPELPLR